MRCAALAFTIVAIVLPVVTVNTVALADDGHGPDFFAVIGVAADDVLNIRALPSASAEKVGELPHDADGIHYDFCIGDATYQEWMEMSETERDAAARLVWCRVAWHGIEGWAAGRFLGESNNP